MCQLPKGIYSLRIVPRFLCDNPDQSRGTWPGPCQGINSMAIKISSSTHSLWASYGDNGLLLLRIGVDYVAQRCQFVQADVISGLLMFSINIGEPKWRWKSILRRGRNCWQHPKKSGDERHPRLTQPSHPEEDHLSRQLLLPPKTNRCTILRRQRIIIHDKFLITNH